MFAEIPQLNRGPDGSGSVRELELSGWGAKFECSLQYTLICTLSGSFSDDSRDGFGRIENAEDDSLP